MHPTPSVRNHAYKARAATIRRRGREFECMSHKPTDVFTYDHLNPSSFAREPTPARHLADHRDHRGGQRFWEGPSGPFSTTMPPGHRMFPSASAPRHATSSKLSHRDVLSSPAGAGSLCFSLLILWCMSRHRARPGVIKVGIAPRFKMFLAGWSGSRSRRWAWRPPRMIHGRVRTTGRRGQGQIIRKSLREGHITKTTRWMSGSRVQARPSCPRGLLILAAWCCAKVFVRGCS